jgi:hypothetical protein
MPTELLTSGGRQACEQREPPDGRSGQGTSSEAPRAERGGPTAKDCAWAADLPGVGQISQFLVIGGSVHLQNAPFFLNNRYFCVIIISFFQKMTGVGHLIMVDFIIFFSTEIPLIRDIFFSFLILKPEKMLRICC